MATTSCLFFEKLPAEIRNAIYELTLTPDPTNKADNEFADEAASGAGYCGWEEATTSESDACEEVIELQEWDKAWEEIIGGAPGWAEVDGQKEDDVMDAADISDTAIELIHATLPSKALIMACSKTYSEAAEIYKKAYREYWTERDFKITMDSTNHPQDDFPLAHLIPSTRIYDVEHISHLKIVCRANLFWVETWTLLDKRGLWELSEGTIWLVGKLDEDAKVRVRDRFHTGDKGLEEASPKGFVRASLVEQLRFLLIDLC